VHETGDVLVEVKQLCKSFPVRQGVFGGEKRELQAVVDVTFELQRGETLGLVGESGSGKTTTGRTILRALDATSGSVMIHPEEGECVDVNRLKGEELRQFRRHMQMIFQDPYSSLSPRMIAREIIAEPLIVNNLARGQELEARVAHMAERCGLQIAHLSRYPHAFSGGQRQRIAIARALVLQPDFVVCDESVSSLDVSIQAQILNLLRTLQQEYELTYLFIAHDLSVVQHISDRVAVMYLGRIVEIARTDDLYFAPQHPYTEALMSAVPVADPSVRMDPVFLSGEIPDPISPPAGCQTYLPQYRSGGRFSSALPLCAGHLQT